ncbi:hypothetical protein F4810DRAFT_682988 [Camillea tinctor]|nr:hypothetical protein F4810DRAFT_682988 [Camillea tinctor]
MHFTSIVGKTSYLIGSTLASLFALHVYVQTTGAMSTSNDDFNNQWNQAQDTYNRTATTISIGWIVGIVIILISIIGFGIAGCYVYRRNRRRRQAREQLNQKADVPTQDNVGLEGGYIQPQSTPLTGPWAQHNEVHGSIVPARFEVANTEVSYKQVPHNDSPRNPYCDPPRSELCGSEAHRSELPG